MSVSELEGRTWVERVRAADEEAENAWQLATKKGIPHTVIPQRALIAIAAELRAQRISQRPHEEPS